MILAQSPRIRTLSSVRIANARPRSRPETQPLLSRSVSTNAIPSSTTTATNTSTITIGGTAREALRETKPIGMADMSAKYKRWTRTDLLDRLELLEGELARRDIDIDAELRARAEAQARELEDQQKQQQSDAAGAEPVEGPKKKKARSADIDPSRYSTRFIALKIAYLGKNYGGFEFQVSAELPTVEEELWKALTTARLIYPKDKRVVDFSCCEYSKCGRTDRGVSALGQVVSLRVRSNRPARPRPAQDEMAVDGDRGEGPEGSAGAGGREAFDDVADELRYTTLLNKLLPADIRVLAWCPSPPEGFSARFSCRERQYRYFFTQPSFLPLPSQYQPRSANGWLDLEGMRAAARRFVGVHDFRNFCKVDAAKQITNFEREIFDADVVEVPESAAALPFLSGDSMTGPAGRAATGVERQGPKVYAVVVRGSGFLWHQVRCMVSILLLVAQGLEPASLISDMLDVEKNPCRTTYIMAHDVPLVLWDCVYPDEGDALRRDSLRWVYPSEECAGDYYGAMAVLDSSWTTWREKKLDEVLAAQLAERVAQGDSPELWPGVERDDDGAAGTKKSKKKKGRQVKPKVFEGGDNGRLVGSYVPVMKLKRMAPPAEVNDQYARKMGFPSAEEMRATDGWRKTIKDVRAAKKRDGLSKA